MKTTALFEYTCPECGRGTVRTTRIQNYKTRIKGYPFVVGEALIGVCDHCQAEEFAPEETKRWEELFYCSLEARQAFLSPQETTELRTALGLSMEDFARLIGCTRQSISMWEKRDRTSPPSRMADLLMKLVRQSLHAGPVDVLTFLLDEARKWGVVIELRRPPTRSEENGSVVLLMKKKPRSVVVQESSPSALAAATSEEEEQIVAETADGRPVGVLDYDYERAALILSVTGDLSPLKAVDVEIETRDGRRFTGQGLSVRGSRLLLLEQTPLRVGDVAQIMLKPHHEETRG
jgi:putative zinc finger/helix-turn-helix YgiT family protein